MYRNVRYGMMKLLMKIFTPRLLEEIKSVNLKGMGFRFKEFNFINLIPRPAIKFMKNYFDYNSLTGCEIGVSMGVNSQSILKELKIKKLYLVDSWKYYGGLVSQSQHDNAHELVCNIFKENNKVEIIRENSVSASIVFKEEELDFVYIDGNHRFNFVLDDLNYWFPKIKYGGVISGHDVFNSYKNGVSEAVKQFCKENNQSYIIDVPDFYIIKEKAEHKTFGGND